MEIMAQDAAGTGRGKGVLLAAMGYEEAEDIYYLNKTIALFDEKRKLFARQDVLLKEVTEIMPERRNKRVHSAAMGYTEEEEEEHYRNKIMKLHEEKRQIARQDALASQVKEREKVKRPMKKKQKQERAPIVSNEVTQRLKEFITNEMKGTEAKVVIQKSLYKSDLEKGQNRLNMPMNQVETHDFLTKDEKEYLKNGNEFEVQLLGPSLQMHEPAGMKLKIWHLKSSNNYVLKTKWNEFVKANDKDLKEKTKIQVWSFRMENKLCFALACLEKVDGQNDAAAAPIV